VLRPSVKFSHAFILAIRAPRCGPLGPAGIWLRYWLDSMNCGTSWRLAFRSALSMCRNYMTQIPLRRDSYHTAADAGKSCMSGSTPPEERQKRLVPYTRPALYDTPHLCPSRETRLLPHYLNTILEAAHDKQIRCENHRCLFRILRVNKTECLPFNLVRLRINRASRRADYEWPSPLQK